MMKQPVKNNVFMVQLLIGNGSLLMFRMILLSETSTLLSFDGTNIGFG